MLYSIPKKFHMLLVFVPAECVLDLHPWRLNQVLVYSLINLPLFPHINSPDNCSSNNSAETKVTRSPSLLTKGDSKSLHSQSYAKPRTTHASTHAVVSYSVIPWRIVPTHVPKMTHFFFYFLFLSKYSQAYEGGGWMEG